MSKSGQHRATNAEMLRQKPQHESEKSGNAISPLPFEPAMLFQGGTSGSQAEILQHLSEPQQHASVQHISETQGNRHVQRVLDAYHHPNPSGDIARRHVGSLGALQTKLEVSEPDDPLELEADAVANEVMHMPAAPPPPAAPGDGDSGSDGASGGSGASGSGASGGGASAGDGDPFGGASGNGELSGDNLELRSVGRVPGMVGGARANRYAQDIARLRTGHTDGPVAQLRVQSPVLSTATAFGMSRAAAKLNRCASAGCRAEEASLKVQREESAEVPLKQIQLASKVNRCTSPACQMEEAALKTNVHRAGEQNVAAEAPSDDLEARVRALKGGGSPLPDTERAFFETRLRRDLSQVRIHTDKESRDLSRDLGARAFAWGGDIAFGDEEFKPGTEGGRWLLAHELAHVIQQGAAKPLEGASSKTEAESAPEMATPETAPGAVDEAAEAAAAEAASQEVVTEDQSGVPAEGEAVVGEQPGAPDRSGELPSQEEAEVSAEEESANKGFVEEQKATLEETLAGRAEPLKTAAEAFRTMPFGEAAGILVGQTSQAAPSELNLPLGVPTQEQAEREPEFERAGFAPVPDQPSDVVAGVREATGASQTVQDAESDGFQALSSQAPERVVPSGEIVDKAVVTAAQPAQAPEVPVQPAVPSESGTPAGMAASAPAPVEPAAPPAQEAAQPEVPAPTEPVLEPDLAKNPDYESKTYEQQSQEGRSGLTDAGAPPSLDVSRRYRTVELDQQRAAADLKVENRAFETETIIQSDYGQHSLYPTEEEKAVQLEGGDGGVTGSLETVSDLIKSEMEAAGVDPAEIERDALCREEWEKRQEELDAEQKKLEEEQITLDDEHVGHTTGEKRITQEEKSTQAQALALRKQKGEHLLEQYDVQSRQQALEGKRRDLAQKEKESEGDPSVAVERAQIEAEAEKLRQRDVRVKLAESQRSQRLKQAREQELSLREQRRRHKSSGDMLKERFTAHKDREEWLKEAREALEEEMAAGCKKGQEGGGGGGGAAAALAADEAALAAQQAALEKEQKELEARRAYLAEQVAYDAAAVMSAAITENQTLMASFATLSTQIDLEAQAEIAEMLATAETESQALLAQAEADAEARQKQGEKDAEQAIKDAEAEAAGLPEEVDPGPIIAGGHAQAQRILAAMQSDVDAIIQAAQDAVQKKLEEVEIAAGLRTAQAATDQDTLATETDLASTAIADQTSVDVGTVVDTGLQEMDAAVAASEAQVNEVVNAPLPGAAMLEDDGGYSALVASGYTSTGAPAADLSPAPVMPTTMDYSTYYANLYGGHGASTQPARTENISTSYNYPSSGFTGAPSASWSASSPNTGYSSYPANNAMTVNPASMAPSTFVPLISSSYSSPNYSNAPATSAVPYTVAPSGVPAGSATSWNMAPSWEQLQQQQTGGPGGTPTGQPQGGGPGDVDPVEQANSQIQDAWTGLTPEEQQLPPSQQAALLLASIQNIDALKPPFQISPAGPSGSSWAQDVETLKALSTPANRTQDQVRMIVESVQNIEGLPEEVRTELIWQAAGIDSQEARAAINNSVIQSASQSPMQQADALLTTLQGIPGFENLPPAERTTAMYQLVVLEAPGVPERVKGAVALTFMDEVETEVVAAMNQAYAGGDTALMETYRGDIDALSVMHEFIGKDFINRAVGFTPEEINTYLNNLNGGLENLRQFGADPSKGSQGIVSGMAGIAQETGFMIPSNLPATPTEALAGLPDVDGTLPTDSMQALLTDINGFDTALLVNGRSFAGMTGIEQEEILAEAGVDRSAFDAMSPGDQAQTLQSGGVTVSSFSEITSSEQAELLSEALQNSPTFQALPPVQQAAAAVQLIEQLPGLSWEAKGIATTAMLDEINKTIMDQAVDIIVGTGDQPSAQQLPDVIDQLKQVNSIYAAVAPAYMAHFAGFDPDDVAAYQEDLVNTARLGINGLEAVQLLSEKLPDEVKLGYFNNFDSDIEACDAFRAHMPLALESLQAAMTYLGASDDQMYNIFRLGDWDKLSMSEISQNMWMEVPEDRQLTDPSFNAGMVARQAYQALESNTDDFFTLISDLNPAELQATFDAFTRYSPKRLDEWNLNFEDQSRLQALMQGNVPMADAIAFKTSDPNEMAELLRNRSEAEIEAIEKAYQARYGASLTSYLDDTLEGADLNRVNAMLAGNTALADAIAIDEALKSNDFAAIEAIYERNRQEVIAETQDQFLDTDELGMQIRMRNQQIEAAYELYKAGAEASGITPERISVTEDRLGSAGQPSLLDQAFSSDTYAVENPSGLPVPPVYGMAQHDLLMALADYDPAKIDAARLAMYTELAGQYPGRLEYENKKLELLRNQYDRAREDVYRDELAKFYDLNQGMLLGRSPEEVALFWQATASPEYIAGMDQQIQDRSKTNMQGFLGAYETQVAHYSTDHSLYPFNSPNLAPMGDAADALPRPFYFSADEDFQNLAGRLIETGGNLPPAEELYYAVRREDKAMINTIIYSSDDPDALEKEYMTYLPEERRRRLEEGDHVLQDDVAGVLEGDEREDALLTLQGTTDPEGQLRILRNRTNYTLNDGEATHFLDWSGLQERSLLSNSLFETEAAYYRWKMAEEKLGPNSSVARQAGVQFEQAMGRTQYDIEQHRTAEDVFSNSVGNAVCTVVTVGLTIVIIVASQGAATPLIVAMGSSFGGSLASMGTQAILEGGNYSGEESRKDFSDAIINTLIAGVTSGMGESLGIPSKFLSEFVEEGTSTVLSTMLTTPPEQWEAALKQFPTDMVIDILAGVFLEATIRGMMDNMPLRNVEATNTVETSSTHASAYDFEGGQMATVTVGEDGPASSVFMLDDGRSAVNVRTDDVGIMVKQVPGMSPQVTAVGSLGSPVRTELDVDGWTTITKADGTTVAKVDPQGNITTYNGPNCETTLNATTGVRTDTVMLDEGGMRAVTTSTAAGEMATNLYLPDGTTLPIAPELAANLRGSPESLDFLMNNADLLNPAADAYNADFAERLIKRPEVVGVLIQHPELMQFSGGDLSAVADIAALSTGNPVLLGTPEQIAATMHFGAGAGMEALPSGITDYQAGLIEQGLPYIPGYYWRKNGAGSDAYYSPVRDCDIAAIPDPVLQDIMMNHSNAGWDAEQGAFAYSTGYGQRTVYRPSDPVTGAPGIEMTQHKVNGKWVTQEVTLMDMTGAPVLRQTNNASGAPIRTETFGPAGEGGVAPVIQTNGLSEAEYNALALSDPDLRNVVDAYPSALLSSQYLQDQILNGTITPEELQRDLKIAQAFPAEMAAYGSLFDDVFSATTPEARAAATQVLLAQVAPPVGLLGNTENGLQSIQGWFAQTLRTQVGVTGIDVEAYVAEINATSDPLEALAAYRNASDVLVDRIKRFSPDINSPTGQMIIQNMASTLEIPEASVMANIGVINEANTAFEGANTPEAFNTALVDLETALKGADVSPEFRENLETMFLEPYRNATPEMQAFMREAYLQGGILPQHAAGLKSFSENLGLTMAFRQTGTAAGLWGAMGVPGKPVGWGLSAELLQVGAMDAGVYANLKTIAQDTPEIAERVQAYREAYPYKSDDEVMFMAIAEWTNGARLTSFKEGNFANLAYNPLLASLDAPGLIRADYDLATVVWNGKPLTDAQTVAMVPFIDGAASGKLIKPFGPEDLVKLMDAVEAGNQAVIDKMVLDYLGKDYTGGNVLHSGWLTYNSPGTTERLLNSNPGDLSIIGPDGYATVSENANANWFEDATPAAGPDDVDWPSEWGGNTEPWQSTPFRVDPVVQPRAESDGSTTFSVVTPEADNIQFNPQRGTFDIKSDRAEKIILRPDGSKVVYDRSSGKMLARQNADGSLVVPNGDGSLTQIDTNGIETRIVFGADGSIKKIMPNGSVEIQAIDQEFSRELQLNSAWRDRYAAIQAETNPLQKLEMIENLRTELQPFGSMDAAQYQRFADLGESGFQRFASLDDGMVRWFASLSKDQFNRFVNMDDTGFQKFVDAYAEIQASGDLAPEVDLAEQELLGGHAIERHGPAIPLSELEQRVEGKHPTMPQSRTALVFKDADTMGRVINQALAANGTYLRAYFASGNTETLELPVFDVGVSIGKGYTNVGSIKHPQSQIVPESQVTKVQLVFVYDPASPTGYRLLTAYPVWP
ncbi:MAG: DUF4157 domain-containing protein [Anaerolineae bacterium]|nr:DUF4157 domain-containing protein [Anaerolineae bacterium]